MIEGRVIVDTGKLLEASSGFGMEAVKVGNIADTLTNMIVSNMQTTWKGPAAELYGRKLRDLNTDIQKMIRMVREHSQDLEEMARNYETTETQNEDDASSLLTNIIM